jgi:hypothetical protein
MRLNLSGRRAWLLWGSAVVISGIYQVQSTRSACEKICVLLCHIVIPRLLFVTYNEPSAAQFRLALRSVLQLFLSALKAALSRRCGMFRISEVQIRS